MEIRVNLKLISGGVVGVSLLFPNPSAAYSRSTHKGISEATIKSFEAREGDVFSVSEETAFVQGSWDEDDDWRFMRHFFDPINNQGLFGQYEASKYWALNTEAQANYECVGAWFCYGDDVDYTEKYFSSPTDYSWDRAVYEYAWSDKVRGVATLGHIIHLIQDATVPAHVRDDAHPSALGIEIQADSYERYTSKYGLGSVPTVRLSRALAFSSLGDSFDQTAMFTNKNFLSQDSIGTYPGPNLNSLKLSGGYAINSDLGVRVASVRSVLNKESNVFTTELLFEKKNESVPEDYWRVLSKKAIESGVGVIDLFFREVEKERKTGVLKAKNTSAAERRAKDNAKKYFAVVKGLYGSSLNQADVEELLGDGRSQAGAAALAVSSSQVEPESSEGIPLQDSASEPIILPRTGPTIQDNELQTEGSTTPSVGPGSSQPLPISEPVPAPQQLIPVTPGFGGGGGGSSNPTSDQVTQDPVPVTLTITAPAADSFFATSTVTFSGSTESGGLITLTSGTNTATTSADGSGNWNLDMLLTEGNPSVTVTATDSLGERATSSAVAIFVDLTPPGLTTVSLSQCASSLSTSFCLVATSTISVSWDSVADASYYAVQVNGVANASSTATTSSATVNFAASSSIAVVSYDNAGNHATSTTVEIYAVENPVRIDEIAWAGTDATASDEWIELRNLTNYAIDMSKVTLDIDGSETALSGTLDASGYYLIEDRAESTSKTHSEAFDMDLPDTGSRILLLSNDGTAIDSTPEIATCAGWCKGSAASVIGTSAQFGDISAKLTMERTSSGTDGALAASWQNNDTYIRTSSSKAIDSASGTIYGTPALANSSGLPEAGWNCGSSTLTSSGGSYNPTSSSCTYLSAFVNTQATRYGDVYKGTVGSSTLASGHSLGKTIQSDQNDSGILTGAVAGDAFFVVIMEIRNFGSDLPDFRSYFQTNTGATPHSNYVTIPWTYSP